MHVWKTKGHPPKKAICNAVFSFLAWYLKKYHGNFHLQSKFDHLISIDFLKRQKSPGLSGAPLASNKSLISPWPFASAMKTGVVNFVRVWRSAPFSIKSKTVALSPFSTAAIKGSNSSCALMLGSAPFFSKYLQRKVRLQENLASKSDQK